MNHILVPFDFSHNSRNALRYAAKLAKLAQANITVLHAYDRAAVLEGMTPDGTEAGMHKEQHHLQSHFGLPESVVFVKTAEGELVDVVSAFLATNEVDLVVMGTRGASGLQEVLVGSRTVELLQEIEVPLLIIPEQASNASVSKILLCSDLKEVEDDNNLDLVKELALLYNAKVRIAHVHQHGEVSTYENQLERGRELSVFRPEVDVAYLQIKGKTILDGIRHYLHQKADIDLLVMINRKHSFVESLFQVNHTHKMAYHTHLPLLVLPETK